MPLERGLPLRRRARAIALQALYEADTTGHDVAGSLAWDSEGPLPETARDFAMGLAQGTLEHREELDEVVRQHAPAWPPSQLAAIDRNILRLALYELTFSQDTPAKVAISEAVELAKRFGSESSARFVNGVLGSVQAERVSDQAQPQNTNEGG